MLILAFLAGRMHTGADPSQATAPAVEAVQSATPAPESDPYDGGGSAPGAPPQGVVPDPRIVPDPGTVPAPGGQDFDPPMTQAS